MLLVIWTIRLSNLLLKEYMLKWATAILLMLRLRSILNFFIIYVQLRSCGHWKLCAFLLEETIPFDGTYCFLLCLKINYYYFYTPCKRPPINFSPVNSTNVEISPKNFPTFNFNAFSTLVWNFKAIPAASPKLLNLNQDRPSKKVFFLVQFL